MVLVAQAVFILACGPTDRQTDICTNWTSCMHRFRDNHGLGPSMDWVGWGRNRANFTYTDDSFTCVALECIFDVEFRSRIPRRTIFRRQKVNQRRAVSRSDRIYDRLVRRCTPPQKTKHSRSHQPLLWETLSRQQHWKILLKALFQRMFSLW